MRPDNVMEVPFFALILVLLLEITNAVHPACECLVFTSTFGKEKGIFKSPDFPKAYPPNIDCLLYTFIGSPDEIIEITFLEFDLKKTNLNCIRGDYVKLFLHLEGGEVNEYTPWAALLCGNLRDIPSPVLFSSGPALVLEFHSTSKTYNSSGFTGTFRFIDRRQFRSDGQKLTGTMCDYQFGSSDYSPTYGKFYSPRYPSSYPKNIRCSYRFRARLKERIRLVFEEVSLQKGDLSCLNRADLIRVYDGKSSSDPAIGVLCNEGTELEVLSTGPDLFIDFVANSDWPGQGFKASFQFQPIEDNSIDSDRIRLAGSSSTHSAGPNVSETRSSCDVAFSSDVSKNGSITSPSYPAPYPSRTTCRYEFQGRGRERVQIVFHDFNLFHPSEETKECENHDSLMAFVHIDGRMEKIDSFCGASIPKPVMSNGPRLKLEFQSLFASRYSRGFKASFSFTENFGIKTGTQLPEYPCAFVFNSNESRSGYFYSPNYPGFYPRDTECHYFFHGNLKERVHLHFNYFDVEGVLPCEATSASDYVEFSNFMARDRKYERHCGQLKEFSIDSDRKFFRVTFRSNDRLDGTGFNATYQFVDEVETFTAKTDSANSAHSNKFTSPPRTNNNFGFIVVVRLAIISLLCNIFT